jgi:molecular chaperone DnaJ
VGTSAASEDQLKAAGGPGMGGFGGMNGGMGGMGDISDIFDAFFGGQGGGAGGARRAGRSAKQNANAPIPGIHLSFWLQFVAFRVQCCQCRDEFPAMFSRGTTCGICAPSYLFVLRGCVVDFLFTLRAVLQART